MRYVRFVKVLAVGAALGAAAAFFLICRLERPTRNSPAPATKANAAFPRERFTAVPVVEDRVPLRERLTPGRRKTRAEELLAGTPAGTEAYEVADAEGETALIYRTPAGEVFVPNETRATVRAYRRAAPFAQLEVRPWVGAGADRTSKGLDFAGAGGLDVVRIWRFHGGPGVLASHDNVAGVVAGGFNFWRNLDVRAGGGYGIEGGTVFIGVGLNTE